MSAQRASMPVLPGWSACLPLSPRLARRNRRPHRRRTVGFPRPRRSLSGQSPLYRHQRRLPARSLGGPPLRLRRCLVEVEARPPRVPRAQGHAKRRHLAPVRRLHSSKARDAEPELGPSASRHARLWQHRWRQQWLPGCQSRSAARRQAPSPRGLRHASGPRRSLARAPPRWTQQSAG